MSYLTDLFRWMAMAIQKLIHVPNHIYHGMVLFTMCRAIQGYTGSGLICDTRVNYAASNSRKSFKYLTYQLLMVRYLHTMAMTGNGELRFCSGEGA